ncbi:MAG: hypothetical protein BroJett030_09230 [Alphaproteobacteria bacterium]|nr:MAG: hypothetical protein BroJett030_09230 [Alphaproteobacteria bacterium]
MGEVVNLRLARKRAARKGREHQAAANRAMHSAPAAERRRVAAERQLAEGRLDGSRRDDPGRDE